MVGLEGWKYSASHARVHPGVQAVHGKNGSLKARCLQAYLWSHQEVAPRQQFIT
jgi:hypothetical protein